MPIAIDSPKTSDGKLIHLPCLFPPGVYMYYAGCADDPVLGRGQGVEFRLASEAAGDSTLEFSFNDWVYLAGGDGMCQGAELGDWITFECYAPATPVTANPGGTGNCNLVEVPNTGGALHVIVPASGNGTHDVDLAAATPVPAGKPGEKTGYWDWGWPDEGRGTITPGAPGASEFNLYDFPITLNRQLPKYQLLGSRTFELTIPAVNPSGLLPHWKNKAILHNSGHSGLKVVWTLVAARYKTV
jgi:hypothetical protein